MECPKAPSFGAARSSAAASRDGSGGDRAAEPGRRNDIDTGTSDAHGEQR